MQAIRPLFYLGFGSWNSHNTHFHQPKIRPKWDRTLLLVALYLSPPLLFPHQLRIPIPFSTLISKHQNKFWLPFNSPYWKGSLFPQYKSLLSCTWSKTKLFSINTPHPLGTFPFVHTPNTGADIFQCLLV